MSASSFCWAGQPMRLALWRRSPLATRTTSSVATGAGSFATGMLYSWLMGQRLLKVGGIDAHHAPPSRR